MSTENHMPDWVWSLYERIASGIEFKGVAYIEGRYSAPDESFLGVHLLKMAPSLIDVSESASDDGGRCFGIIHRLDLMTAHAALDEVMGMSFGIENDGWPSITLEGKVGERDVVILIYAYPFEDAEARAIIDKSTGFVG